VDQVSKPYLVIVAVLVLFAGAWFTVLRPKEPAAEKPLPTAPGMTGLNNATKGANAAVAASGKSADAKDAAAGSAASEPVGASAKPSTPTEASAAPGTAKGAKPKPGDPAPVLDGDPSRYVLADLDEDRTAVVLFYDKRGSDDRSVLRELKRIDRHDGQVTVHVARIGRVGEFQAITRGVKILTSPTVLVIGPDKKARTITGFTVTREIDQMVSDLSKFSGR